MINFKFMFITNNPSVAEYVVNHGVDRVFVDLEIIGKHERQGHLDTVISCHLMQDISSIRPFVPRGALLVRVNPININTEAEVDEAIERGADILMLPMFRAADEVRRFCDAVNKRAKVCLLVETVGAMENLAECIKVPGVAEVHIGLNDLHIEMGCGFMFEPLVSGHVSDMAETLAKANMPFGIGGVARVGEGMLPAELILSEHSRLGSSCAILSRSFHRRAKTVEEIEASMSFGEEINKLREAYKNNCEADSATLNQNHKKIKELVAGMVKKIRESSSKEKIVN
jgi:2-keto-3-deoxy-L-rhamnonate aldolase RhmA